MMIGIGFKNFPIINHDSNQLQFGFKFSDRIGVSDYNSNSDSDLVKNPIIFEFGLKIDSDFHPCFQMPIETLHKSVRNLKKSFSSAQNNK